MPPVRNGSFINVDDRTESADDATSATSSLHILSGNHRLINDTQIPMHSHLAMQSTVNATMKQCNQYGGSSPAMVHQRQQHQRQQHSSGASSQQSNQQHTPLTKAELRKVNNAVSHTQGGVDHTTHATQ